MRRTGVEGRGQLRRDAHRRDGSVLGRVRVIPDVGVPPGLQLERQIAVMVREARLRPGRRLPSTRRLASRAGAHRNTVAAAYRRLAARGLIEVRHGARARVASALLPHRDPPLRPGVRDRGRAPSGDVVGLVRAPGLAAVAEEPATARLMAAELSACLDAGVSAETGRPSLWVALPGAARCPPDVVRPTDAGAPDPIRARQDRRPQLERLLRSAPTLAVVALLSGCPALREAVRCDVARLRGDAVTLRPVDPRDGDGIRAAREADLLIADRIAREALLESGPADGTRSVHGVRLLDRRTIAAVRRRLAVPADDSPSRTEEATP